MHYLNFFYFFVFSILLLDTDYRIVFSEQRSISVAHLKMFPKQISTLFLFCFSNAPRIDFKKINNYQEIKKLDPGRSRKMSSKRLLFPCVAVSRYLQCNPLFELLLFLCLLYSSSGYKLPHSLLGAKAYFSYTFKDLAQIDLHTFLFLFQQCSQN